MAIYVISKFYMPSLKHYIVKNIDTIAKYWKQPKCPLANKWIKKPWYIYTMEFYAAERKKELILLCNGMDGIGQHFAK